YRRALRIEGFGSAATRSVAVGEGRVAGTIEAAEVTLVSPLQSQGCVYYRAVVEAGDGRSRRRVFSEERGVGFRVRDASGAIRVFPRGARWDVPDTWSADSLFGDPAGLELRDGPATRSAVQTRDQAIAELLTVHRPDEPGSLVTLGADPSGGRHSYREARLSVGDAVTVVGMVLPFDQLPDPSAANEEAGAAAADETADPVVAAELERARASGGLAADPDTAWGNAAIEGFGIDRPVRNPVLDPAAHRPTLAPAGAAEVAHQTFDIAPETLVLAATPSVALLISAGLPSAAESRNEGRFVLGLGGAALAVVSAVALALLATGAWR
ncbi:MAG TPA: hypothetical protein VET90_02575, partial [Candidatus Binatus sp.]|nr:hypothetical protein [Candidatus Binatus sp.]